VTAIPNERPVILATGPLTGDLLADSLAKLVGAEHLAYYDAIAPIVSADSIDRSIVFAASRSGRGNEHEDDQAYLNCPFNKEQYDVFVKELVDAQKVAPREFEQVRYFEGCLPVELMAERGPRTLSFGPMKPMGLTDPRTGRWPHAVVQLRPEDHAKTAYNLVGFQTRMTYGEQARVFRTIPGLENVEFLRFGSVHRNTFVDAPTLLDETMQLKAAPGVFLAGQITGVEGYVESAAGGFLCALLLAQRLAETPLDPPPATTALGALLGHLKRPNDRFQPSNVTWAQFPPLDDPRLRKPEKYQVMADRALGDLSPWLERIRS
jgi:methylenetetrahydrofolate--tRNA-(uracil-5-)-methyltransferase